ADGEFTYLWSNGGSSASITVNEPGNYSVTITGENGCSDEASVTVEQNNTTADAMVTGNVLLDCNTTSITLDASSSTADGEITYLWSNGATTASIIVDEPGIYSVTITGENGCSDEASVTVEQNITEANAVITGNEILTCNTTSVTLDAGTSTAEGDFNYLWSNVASTASIIVNEPGIYSVVITGENGCFDEASVTVEQNITEANAVITGNEILTCDTTSVTLNADSSTADGEFTYLWSNGASTASITVNEPGIYSVVITGENGCSDEASVTVEQNTTTSNAVITGNEVLTCNTPSVILDASSSTADGEITYLWSNGETTASIYVSEAGTYSVTITGENGCSDETSETVIFVPDTEAPVFDPVNDITVNVDAGICGATVNFEVPTATDNCEGTVVNLTEGLEPGSEYPVGTTTVTYTATDAAGNTVSTSFTVTVIDNEAPVIACIENISQATDSGSATAVVTFEAPVGTDNCGATTEQTAGLPSGSEFPIGTTTNTYVVTDAAGNTATCSFTVTITDDEDPTISCPANINMNVDAGLCGAVVEFEIPEANDNSGNVTVTQTAGPASGEVFPVGTTTVSFTATDEAGNTATCSFTVTVADNEAPVFDAVSNITVNVDAGICGATVNFEIPTATDNCEGTVVTLTEGLAPGSEFPVGTTTVTYTATDAAGNTVTTSFSVTVIDNEAPVIACIENISQATDMGSATAVVTFDAPVGTDNCGATTEQTAGLPSGSEFPIGTTTNTYVVTDAAGNTATCSFTVTITDDEDPTISCPANINMNVDAGICGAVVIFEMPEANDNSGTVTITQTAGPASGEVFPVGTTTVSFTATDEAGNTATCSFTVTVADNEAPVFDPISNITVNVDAGICGATVNFEVPTATDNCEGTVVTLTEGLAPGSEFPVGTTTVTYTATDAAGNTVSTSFTVTVIDNEAPVFDPISNITVNVDAGICGAPVNFEVPTATDNCEGTVVTLTEGLAPGSEFPVGTTTVTYTASDAVGNSVSISFTVTVIDNEAPVIACIENISLATDMGSATAVVTFEAPVGTDNCGATTEQTAGLPSGSEFPIGTTTNTYVVTDTAGNTATCSFTVTVVDEEDPTISCPANINMNVDAGICGAVVEFEMPVANDNSGNVIITQTAGPASGEVFPVGTTTVSFTATDEAGNTATCSFTVTVADNEAPVFDPVSNITVNVDAGICGATVNFEVPTATDNCEGTVVTLTEGLAPGSEFPVGTTTVTYTAIDAAGNIVTISFTVTVVDNIAPVISCNENISVDVEFGVTSAVVNYNAPTATDNCPGTTIAQREGLSSGSEFPVGTTTNTFIVTDAAGNTATCSFTVTVVELPEPTPATPVIVEVVQPTCEVPTGTIEVETEEGLTYSINGTDYQESGFFSDLEPGTYSVTARNSSGAVSEPVQVTLAEPSATLTITTSVQLCNDNTAEDIYDLFDLVDEESDQTGTWMDTSQTGELNGSLINPKNFAAGRYTFTYVVAGGCPSSTEVTVEIIKCIVLPCDPDNIKISKAVTPNGDGFNDFLTIDAVGSELDCFTYNVKIFNRWGAEIFSAVNYNNNWDGQSNRSVTSSNQLPSGTYYYIVDVKDRSNGGHIKSIQSYIYLGTK
ncbi:MAG TPA: HYR domain-containing protein, partial [Gillisia sp.]|nr:HYR domain-containing protein [Gillisia sp.]